MADELVGLLRAAGSVAELDPGTAWDLDAQLAVLAQTADVLSAGLATWQQRLQTLGLHASVTDAAGVGHDRFAELAAGLGVARNQLRIIYAEQFAAAEAHVSQIARDGFWGETAAPAEAPGGPAVDIGEGVLFLGDVNAGAVAWTGTGPAGGREVDVDNGTDRAKLGLTRAQMHQLRDQLAASLTDPTVAPELTTPDGSVSWHPAGPGQRVLRIEADGEAVEVSLTEAQVRAISQQLTEDLAVEAKAAETFPGVTGRLEDKHAGVRLDNDAQLSVPAGALSTEDLAACGRAVRLYRNSTYREIPVYLRGGEDKVLQIREQVGQQEPSLEPVSQHVAWIDQAMAAAPLAEPIEVYRGVHDLPEVIGHQLDGDLVGIEWTEQSFPSTSVEAKVATIFAGEDTLLKLHVPAGVGAIQLDSRPTQREHTREAEILLQRRLRMRIVGEHHEDIGGGGVFFVGDEMRVGPPTRYRVLDIEVTLAGAASTATDDQAAAVFAPAPDPGRSGAGWVTGPAGQRGPWGRYGAAGALICHQDDDGPPRYLMVRASTGADGAGRWQLPGGARDEHETPHQTAARETHEELGVPYDDLAQMTPHAQHVYERDGWSYTTVTATTPQRFDVHAADWETTDAAWLTRAEIADLDRAGQLIEPLSGHAIDAIIDLIPDKSTVDNTTKSA